MAFLWNVYNWYKREQDAEDTKRMAEDTYKLARDGIGGGGIEGDRGQAYRTADGMAAGLDMAIGGFPGGSDAAGSFGKSAKRGFHDIAPTEWGNLYYENLETGKISQTQYPTYQDYRRAVENNEIDINGKPLTPSDTPPDSNPSSTNPSASDPRRNDPNVGILSPPLAILPPRAGNNTGGSNTSGNNTGGSNTAEIIPAEIIPEAVIPAETIPEAIIPVPVHYPVDLVA